MPPTAPPICSRCQRPLAAGVAFCTTCGTPVAAPLQPHDDIHVSGGRRVRVDAERVSLESIQSLVVASMAWWQQQLQHTDALTRQNAAEAIQQLSQILASLSQQLAQGRDVVKITTRLPQVRRYPQHCARCGAGNREEARFCRVCGAALAPVARPRHTALSVSIAACTDVGRRRSVNQDVAQAEHLTSLHGDTLTLLIVADGMGGGQAGDTASTLAAGTVRAELLVRLTQGLPSTDAAWHAALGTAVQVANTQVYQMAQSDPRYAGMGTTLTVAVLIGQRLHLAHVGDSRAYLCNQAGIADELQPSQTHPPTQIVQLTVDHSLVARLVDIGQLTPEAARTHPQRNIIYRALGGQAQIEVDTQSHALSHGDLVLLCSDGLPIHVEDHQIAELVLTDQPLAARCRACIATANAQGGSDNIGVVLAQLTTTGTA